MTSLSPEPPEARLLSLPRTGETLRFSWTRAVDGRFRMSLEGIGIDKTEGRSLGNRIEAFLSLMEQDGVEFTDFAASTAEDENGREASTWVEIVPDEHHLPLGGDGVIGFGGSGDSRRSICLPALGAVRAPDLSGYFLDLVANAETVREVCLCFTRRELNPEREAVLERNLQLPFPEALKLAAQTDLPDDLRRFMALWLIRRRGWEVRILARVSAGEMLPEVPLELLGREWFDAECRVKAARAVTEAVDDPLDFSTLYPDGWGFPRLFPSAYATDRLDVESRVNSRLPPLPLTGQVIGEASGHTVRLPDACREQHTYILGATGTGKSTLLKRMIRHDLAGEGAVLLLDPHGDLYKDVLKVMPKHRQKDLLLLDPGSRRAIPAFNILADLGEGAQRRQRVEFIIGELLYIFKDQWTDCAEAFGPMFELYFRNTVLLLAHQPVARSLADFDRVLGDDKFRKELLSTCDRDDVKNFWQEIAAKAGGDARMENVAPYISCKVSPLLQSYYVGDMIRHKKNSLDLDARLNRGGVVLVNLDKGLLGHAGSRLLGTLLTSELFSAGLRRGQIKQGDRSPVNVFIDEFQNFISPTVGSMFAEARKFGLRLHVANQTLGQLTHSRDNLRHSVLGNVGNQIFFRVGVQDSGDLEPFFHPFTRGEMQELPNFQPFSRLMTREGPLRPFIMRTLPDV